MTLSRRKFLRVATASAALGATGAVGSRALGALDPEAKLRSTLRNTQNYAGSILTSPASSAPIDTLVILMMENRSFDHYLGWLPTDEQYLETGLGRYGPGFHVDGTNQRTYDVPGGGTYDTYYLPTKPGEADPSRGCGHPDPGHGWDSGRAQRDHGFLAEGSGNDEYALGYFLEPDLPTYGPLVRGFTTFDHYHCSLLSSTYPNRYYQWAAQSDGSKEGSLPIAEAGFDWPNIADRLLAAGVSVGNYCTDLPVAAFWGPRMLPIIRPLAQYFVDCAAGTLPRVVFVDPGFMSGLRTDDHPHGDMRVGQAFVGNVYTALRRSPQWSRSALIVNYDEWGGFFDSVPPPTVVDERSSTNDEDNFGQLGFRTPTFLASPYARPGFVDHRLYDHTSILRFLEWRFLGAPAEGPAGSGWWLTERDRNTANIGASLMGERQQDADAEVEIRGGLLTTESPPCPGQWFQDVPVLVDVEDHPQAEPLRQAEAVVVDAVHPMEQALHAGLFERVGFRVSPSMTLAELTSPIA